MDLIGVNCLALVQVGYRLEFNELVFYIGPHLSDSVDPAEGAEFLRLYHVVDPINGCWSVVIRIVCNTLVRNFELWLHINPHVIVAGNRIYHFGASDYAKVIEEGVKLRLQDSPEIVFTYPAFFDGIVSRGLAGLSNRFIPIPSGGI